MENKVMTQEERTRAQARGCIQLGDLAIFAFGAFIMFAKTANLLGKFAPDDWFGFASSDYGFAAAILIEGYLVFRKIKAWLLPPTNFVEWAADLITTLIPFVLSAAAQVIDGYVTTGIIVNMPEETKMMITAIVSILITIPILLDILKTAIDNAPVGIFDNIKSDNGNILQGFLGWVNNRVDARKHGVSSTVALNQDVRQLKKVKSTNGKNPQQQVDP